MDEQSFPCLPVLVGRYVYVRIPGSNNVLNLCEVEVYSTRHNSNSVKGIRFFYALGLNSTKWKFVEWVLTNNREIESLKIHFSTAVEREFLPCLH